MGDFKNLSTKNLLKLTCALVLIAGGYAFLGVKDVSWVDAATVILLICVAQWQLETQTEISAAMNTMTEHLKAVEERLRSIDNTLVHVEKTQLNRQS